MAVTHWQPMSRSWQSAEPEEPVLPVPAAAGQLASQDDFTHLAIDAMLLEEETLVPVGMLA